MSFRGRAPTPSSRISSFTRRREAGKCFDNSYESLRKKTYQTLYTSLKESSLIATLFCTFAAETCSRTVVGDSICDVKKGGPTAKARNVWSALGAHGFDHREWSISAMITARFPALGAPSPPPNLHRTTGLCSRGSVIKRRRAEKAKAPRARETMLRMEILLEHSLRLPKWLYFVIRAKETWTICFVLFFFKRINVRRVALLGRGERVFLRARKRVYTAMGIITAARLMYAMQKD